MYGLTRRLALLGLLLTGVAPAALAAAQPLGVALLTAQPAAATADDITGVWIVTVNAPQGRMDLETSFTQTGEAITGEVKMPAGPLAFRGTLVMDTLSVTYTAEAQGQPVEIRFTGRATSEAMAGSVDLGGLMQVPWTAKRKPTSAEAAPSPASPAAGAGDVTGTWTIGLQLGPALMPLTARLVQQGQSIAGTMTSPLGAMPVAGTTDANGVALTVTLALPQGPVTVTMRGQLTPAGLSGTSSIPGLGDMPWSATRTVE